MQGSNNRRDMKSYSTLLLDLDGTLLDIEVSFFLGPMVEAMHECFRDVLDMDRFRKGLFGGTEAIMVEPRSDGETNRDGFNRTFSSLTGMDIPDIDQRFRQFYTNVFPTLNRYGRPVAGASGFIARAAEEGYTPFAWPPTLSFPHRLCSRGSGGQEWTPMPFVSFRG